MSLCPSSTASDSKARRPADTSPTSAPWKLDFLNWLLGPSSACGLTRRYHGHLQRVFHQLSPLTKGKSSMLSPAISLFGARLPRAGLCRRIRNNKKKRCPTTGLPEIVHCLQPSHRFIHADPQCCLVKLGTVRMTTARTSKTWSRSTMSQLWNPSANWRCLKSTITSSLAAARSESSAHSKSTSELPCRLSMTRSSFLNGEADNTS